MQKVIIFIRYLLFFPASFIFAIIISGLVSVIQNFISLISCKFMLIAPYGICSNNFEQRTFLADLIFPYLVIYFSILIIPKFKKEAAIIELIFFDLIYLLLSISFLLKAIININTLETVIIGFLLIITTVLLIQNKTKITIL
ncbi:MAG TPA: hypothetical protein PLG15_01305 [Candidatus Gastranaerophilaceae bacterium]|nr:hypothetical protein [Candidatus Gastranaerophilaceae bacterium]HPT41005.1 hypothetical protein [Candidatus Gastranaerophilaceae bacterium]